MIAADLHKFSSARGYTLAETDEEYLVLGRDSDTPLGRFPLTEDGFEEAH